MKKTLMTCEQCKGDCCTGMALQIPTPRSQQDFEDTRWYLFHEKTHLYIDHDGDWIAEMDLPCSHRDPRTGRCRIYAMRPPVCREARHADCERNLDDAQVRFRTVEEYDAWVRTRIQTKQSRKGRAFAVKGQK